MILPQYYMTPPHNQKKKNNDITTILHDTKTYYHHLTPINKPIKKNNIPPRSDNKQHNQHTPNITTILPTYYHTKKYDLQREEGE